MSKSESWKQQILHIINTEERRRGWVRREVGNTPTPVGLRAPMLQQAADGSSSLDAIQTAIQPGSHLYGVSAAGTDAYAITLSPAITALTVGMVVRVQADVANTGAATLQVNSLPASPAAILKNHDVPLVTGDIESGMIFAVAWDGTNWQLLSLTAGEVDLSGYLLLAGRAGGQTASGGDAANDDLTLQGTTHATRTTSYLLLQPNGGNTGVNCAAPAAKLEVDAATATDSALILKSSDGVNGITTNLLAFYMQTSKMAWFNYKGTFYTTDGIVSIDGSSYETVVQGAGINGIALSNASQLRWSNSANWYSTLDVGLSRNAAGILEVNNGTAGTIRSLLALLRPPAGTASAVGLILPSGVVLTSPAAGAEEADSTRRYWTNAAVARKTYAWLDEIPILVGDTRRIVLDYRNGWPSATEGSGLWTRVEYGLTNLVNQYTSEFLHTGTKSLEFTTNLPDDYNGGTITAQIWWSTTSATGNDVVWSVAARVYHDGDALDAAWGTAQTATDTNQGADKRMISPATAAITIANTPAAGDELQVRIQRTPGAAGDTLDDSVRLHRVVLFYTVA